LNPITRDEIVFPSRTLNPNNEFIILVGESKHTLEECVERDLTYASPLYVSVLLAGTEVPEPIRQDIFLGDFPEMTEKGTFIVNGTERVVVSQLIRSPGVYFEAPIDRSTGRPLALAKLIPDRGAWMEFETRKSDYLTLRFNRKRTVPITIFLRALALVNDGLPDSPIKYGTDEELLEIFADVDNNPDRLFIPSTFSQEPDWDIKIIRLHSQHYWSSSSVCVQAIPPHWIMPENSWKNNSLTNVIMTWSVWDGISSIKNLNSTIVSRSNTGR
jgi:DNA-directed RNA polymerase subunit beta